VIKMAFSSETKESCRKAIKKACKKNSVLRDILEKKMKQILRDPSHYKPLMHDLAGERRVHILKSFVLVFEINYTEEKVIFLRYGHHNEIYERRG